MVIGLVQGGGPAGIISKFKQVERIVMFTATAWMYALSRNAD
jgi:hypothetical protein